MADEPSPIPPEDAKQIADYLRDRKGAAKPLCPSCGRRPQGPDGLCADCASELAERDKARKRRWWSKHADEKRLAARSLEEIASDIHESYEVGRVSYEEAIEAYFTIGRDLVFARKQLPADQDFGRWFRAQRFPFSRQWAWTLREAAENEAEVREAVATGLRAGLRPSIKRALAQVRGQNDNGAQLERAAQALPPSDPPADCRHCPIHCECA